MYLHDKLTLGNNYKFDLNSLEEMKKSNNESNNKTFLIINILFAISVLVSIISLNNNLIISVLTKMKEFSIKRTIGMSLKQLFTNITIQGLILGIEGGILGLVLGCILNLYLVKILLFYIGELSFSINYLTIFVLIMFSGLIGFLSSLYPFRYIRKLNIMQAIKGNE